VRSRNLFSGAATAVPTASFENSFGIPR
jgi:hypothetical protein